MSTQAQHAGEPQAPLPGSQVPAVVEMRTYTLLPGKVPEYLALYAAEGLPTQSAILGQPLGYYSVEVGGLNRVMHLWAFQDHAQRERLREQLRLAPAWQAYWARARLLVLSQENCFLRAAPFFVQRLAGFVASGTGATVSHTSTPSTLT